MSAAAAPVVEHEGSVGVEDEALGLAGVVGAERRGPVVAIGVDAVVGGAVDVACGREKDGVAVRAGNPVALDVQPGPFGQPHPEAGVLQFGPLGDGRYAPAAVPAPACRVVADAQRAASGQEGVVLGGVGFLGPGFAPGEEVAEVLGLVGTNVAGCPEGSAGQT